MPVARRALPGGAPGGVLARLASAPLTTARLTAAPSEPPPPCSSRRLWLFGKLRLDGQIDLALVTRVPTGDGHADGGVVVRHVHSHAEAPDVVVGPEPKDVPVHRSYVEPAGEVGARRAGLE